MAWFKLDDRGAYHAKVLRAGNEAYGAWCRAGQWSSQHLTDGLIPKEVADSIASPKIWKRLCDAGLLEDRPDGWQIHDFLDWNPSRQEVTAERERVREIKSKAGKAGASARWQGDSRQHGKAMAPAMAPAIGLPSPLPCTSHGPVPDPDPLASTKQDHTHTARVPARVPTRDEAAVRDAVTADDQFDGANVDATVERIGKRLAALAPEHRWPDLGAEVAGWIAHVRKESASARDAGRHWGAERCLAEFESKALNRIRYRPADAAQERQRRRTSSSSKQFSNDTDTAHEVAEMERVERDNAKRRGGTSSIADLMPTGSRKS
jgi:hypothetical protein